MRRWSVRVGAAVAAAAVLLSTPGVARADPQWWIRIPCFSGAIDRVSTDGQLLMVDGHVECDNPQPGYPTFMYATYRGKQATAYWSTAVEYNTVGPTPNSIQKILPHGEYALCLVTDFTVPVACVAISPDPDTTIAVVPLSVDDSRVSGAVRVLGDDEWNYPVCGTCW
jgi:hypothetical protein